MDRAANGSNYCKVTLINDTYKVEFKSIRGTSIKDKGTFEDVYNDMLQHLFERRTGLCLTMPRILVARAAKEFVEIISTRSLLPPREDYYFP